MNQTGFLVGSITFDAVSCSSLYGERAYLQNTSDSLVLVDALESTNSPHLDPIRTTQPPSDSDLTDDLIWLFVAIIVGIVVATSLVLWCCCSACKPLYAAQTSQPPVALSDQAIEYTQIDDATVVVPDR
ncbi:hypothetical protein AC1031_021053 [Aphanomyces cochlioides]|nr:hypothetical protein AC1031_021053 [Aphanomyces cochlioides]